MSFRRYDAFEDPYSYEGSNTLKNILDIRDEAELEAFEVEMTHIRSSEPYEVDQLDVAAYCGLHRHWFQDVYDWAGKYRTVRTSKGGNSFCYPEHIDNAMKKLFGGLAEKNYFRDLPAEGFIKESALFLSELNAIHPFREGNGRIQLAFVDMLAIQAGHPLEIDHVQPEPFMNAMIASFSGDLAPLIRQLEGLLVDSGPAT